MTNSNDFPIGEEIKGLSLHRSYCPTEPAANSQFENRCNQTLRTTLGGHHLIAE